ncbi:DUF2812 domain-containing protein [Konateibacter massiliensis]|uniref:DUF2812 domain-containing protein n=1 Tax=Konateibacter massiliensis TaxID=2002841 RepID=UPI000C15E32D|nr:DUF2812 domain-containing protein [Konateibacter massiliensis]
MIKFRFFINYEKEEKWLEGIAKRGWQLRGKMGYLYLFAKTELEAKTIKIDYRTFRDKQDFIDYCSLFEDSGWKHVAGTKSSGTQYFRKISNDSDEDIFSDALSKAGRYKRLADVWLFYTILYIPCFLILLVQERSNPNSLPDVKVWYWLPWLCVMLLYALFTIKALILYRKAVKSSTDDIVK